MAGAQIMGGMLVPHLGRLFNRRTTMLFSGIALGTAVLAVVGFVPNFWVAIAALVVWGVLFSASLPVRQSYLNAIIPSKQRATMLPIFILLHSEEGLLHEMEIYKANGKPIAGGTTLSELEVTVRN